eukprot:scaffold665901_cov65-Prasinocladus_malaysianus.AAC.1
MHSYAIRGESEPVFYNVVVDTMYTIQCWPSFIRPIAGPKWMSSSTRASARAILLDSGYVHGSINIFRRRLGALLGISLSSYVWHSSPNFVMVAALSKTQISSAPPFECSQA